MAAASATEADIAPDDSRLQRCAFAKLQGQDFEFFIRKYEIVLGRQSSSASADVVLGDNMNLSRKHATISYNFERGVFELTVLGKNGVVLDGMLHTPGGNPVPLTSQMLLGMGDRTFYFLLPRIPGKPKPKRKPKAPKAESPQLAAAAPRLPAGLDLNQPPTEAAAPTAAWDSAAAPAAAPAAAAPSAVHLPPQFAGASESVSNGLQFAAPQQVQLQQAPQPQFGGHIGGASTPPPQPQFGGHIGGASTPPRQQHAPSPQQNGGIDLAALSPAQRQLLMNAYANHLSAQQQQQQHGPPPPQQQQQQQMTHAQLAQLQQQFQQRQVAAESTFPDHHHQQQQQQQAELMQQQRQQAALQQWQQLQVQQSASSAGQAAAAAPSSVGGFGSVALPLLSNSLSQQPPQQPQQQQSAFGAAAPGYGIPITGYGTLTTGFGGPGAVTSGAPPHPQQQQQGRPPQQ